MKSLSTIISKVLTKSVSFGIFFFLTPFFASAEAGKGITDESIILALVGMVILLVNQVYLIITSIKKIMNPEKKSSILHYITIVISIVIFAIYFPNKGNNSLFLFELFITVPLILGIISFILTIYNWTQKKK